MPGSTQERAYTTQVLVTCKYYNNPESVPVAGNVTDNLENLYFSFARMPVFKTLAEVIVIDPAHPEAPSQFKQINPWASLYDTATRKIWINAAFWNDSGDVLYHEFGHHLWRQVNVWDGADVFGKAAWAYYKAVRPSDPVENFANDFEAAFRQYVNRFPAAPQFFHMLAAARGL